MNLSTEKKIYILTIGEYSDKYVHDKACLSMEDAECLIADLNLDERECVSVEELEIYDPQEKIKYIIPDVIRVYVHADYNDCGCCYDHFISIDRRPSLTIDPISLLDICKNRISFYMDIKDPLAKTSQSFDENIEKIQKRMEKIAWDRLAKIQSLLKLEGWTKEIIETTMNNTILAFGDMEEEKK